MSCLEYLTSVKIIMIAVTLVMSGIGTSWCTYVEDGDRLYLRHHTVSILKFSVQTKLQSGRIWVSGQHFLSSLIITRSITSLVELHSMKTISLPHSTRRTSIVYVLLGLA